jgi:Mrp family chromosome partitioning ATPase
MACLRRPSSNDPCPGVVYESVGTGLGDHNMGNPTSTGTIITVFGADHCTAKTTIAVNLAAALAQGTGRRVALIDLDTFAGDCMSSATFGLFRPFANGHFGRSLAPC